MKITTCKELFNIFDEINDAVHRGKAFEKFALYYLKHNPDFSKLITPTSEKLLTPPVFFADCGN